MVCFPPAQWRRWRPIRKECMIIIPGLRIPILFLPPGGGGPLISGRYGFTATTTRRRKTKKQLSVWETRLYGGRLSRECWFFFIFSGHGRSSAFYHWFSWGCSPFIYHGFLSPGRRLSIIFTRFCLLRLFF